MNIAAAIDATPAITVPALNLNASLVDPVGLGAAEPELPECPELVAFWHVTLLVAFSTKVTSAHC